MLVPELLRRQVASMLLACGVFHLRIHEFLGKVVWSQRRGKGDNFTPLGI
jgi:hypothetical protein